MLSRHGKTCFFFLSEKERQPESFVFLLSEAVSDKGKRTASENSIVF